MELGGTGQIIGIMGEKVLVLHRHRDIGSLYLLVHRNVHVPIYLCIFHFLFSLLFQTVPHNCHSLLLGYKVN